MIIRKTHRTKRKKIYRDKHALDKIYALYRVTTYWFLCIPIYQTEQFID